MYGSLYNDEMPIYKEKIEEQFKGCSEKALADGMEIMAWGFDVLVEDPTQKKIAEDWAEECARKYFPGVENVSVLNKNGKAQ